MNVSGTEVIKSVSTDVITVQQYQLSIVERLLAVLLEDHPFKNTPIVGVTILK